MNHEFIEVQTIKANGLTYSISSNLFIRKKTMVFSFQQFNFSNVNTAEEITKHYPGVDPVYAMALIYIIQNLSWGSDIAKEHVYYVNTKSKSITLKLELNKLIEKTDMPDLVALLAKAIDNKNALEEHPSIKVGLSCTHGARICPMREDVFQALITEVEKTVHQHKEDNIEENKTEGGDIQRIHQPSLYTFLYNYKRLKDTQG